MFAEQDEYFKIKNDDSFLKKSNIRIWKTRKKIKLYSNINSVRFIILEIINKLYKLGNIKVLHDNFFF